MMSMEHSLVVAMFVPGQCSGADFVYVCPDAVGYTRLAVEVAFDKLGTKLSRETKKIM
jgi:hypothetical protein